MKLDSLFKPSLEGINLNPIEEVGSLESPFVPVMTNRPKLSMPTSTTSVPTASGKTAAERNRNPLNIKFGAFAAKYGASKENKAALDGGSFATFPTVESGLQAARDLLMTKNYKNLTVDAAMKRWSNSGYGGEIYKEIAKRPINSLNDNELKELQKRQIIREDRGYAKKLGYLKYGGYTLPKYYYGGLFLNGEGSSVDLPEIQRKPKPLAINLKAPSSASIKSQPYSQPANDIGGRFDFGNLGDNAGQGIAAGLGIIGQSLEKNKGKTPNRGRTIGSSTLKGAGSGASIGTSILPGWGTAIGAVVGGVAGAIGGGNRARREQEEWDKIQAIQNSNFKDLQMNRSSYLYRQFNPYVYKYGGKTIDNPEFEVEKGEVIRGNNVNITDGERLSSGLQLVTGYTHEQNNPKTGGKGVYGNGEGIVYSNSINLGNGKTPASIAKSLAIKLRKFEVDVNGYDPIKKVTAEKMIKKIDMQLDGLFELQENIKVPRYKYGGRLPKLATGGNTDDRIVKRSDGSYWLQTSNGGWKRLTKESVDRLQSNNKSNFLPDFGIKTSDIPNWLKPISDSALAERGAAIENRVNQILKDAPKVRQDRINYDKAFRDEISRRRSNISAVANRNNSSNNLYNVVDSDRNVIVNGLRGVGDFISNVWNTWSRTPSPDSGVISRMPNQGRGDVLVETVQPTKPDGTFKYNPGVNRFAKRIENSPQPTSIPGNQPSRNSKPTSTKSLEQQLKDLENRNARTLDNAVLPELSRRSINSIPTRNITPNGSRVIRPSNLSTPSPTTTPNTNFNWGNAVRYGMIGAGYLANVAALNKMETSIPVNLTHSPYYGYADRSRSVRQEIQGMVNSLINNPNISTAQKQAALATGLSNISQVNAQENANRLSYDNAFANQQFQIDAQNNAIINNSRLQSMNLRNERRYARAGAFQDLFTNVNTTLQEDAARSADLKKLDMMLGTYRDIYGSNFANRGRYGIK